MTMQESGKQMLVSSMRGQKAADDMFKYWRKVEHLSDLVRESDPRHVSVVEKLAYIARVSEKLSKLTEDTSNNAREVGEMIDSLIEWRMEIND